MTILEARDHLGDIATDLSDEEVQELINQCEKFASIIFDFAEKEAR